MYMKVSVVTKFYEILRRKILKNIYNCMHILFIFSRSLFVESATSLVKIFDEKHRINMNTTPNFSIVIFRVLKLFLVLISYARS
jgi:hypothetical protein